MDDTKNKKKIVDITPQPSRRLAARFISDYQSERENLRKRQDRSKTKNAIHIFRFALIGIIVLVVLGAGVYVARLFLAKDVALVHATGFKDSFGSALNGLSELDFLSAQQDFQVAHSHLNGLKRLDARLRVLDTLAIIGSFAPKKYEGLSKAPELFQSVDDINVLAIKIARITQEVKELAPRYLISEDGTELIELLVQLKEQTSQMRSILPDIQGQIATLHDIVPQLGVFQGQFESRFISADILLHKSEMFLDTFIKLLSGADEKYMAVIFQNPSEIRATGGFIGSYAEVPFSNGAIKKIEIIDIYDPDGQLKVNIIPPKQLRNVTTRWGARDANWFFDFPTSMAKFLELLEASLIYQERGVAFQGVVSINTRIIEDLLEIVGPIDMPEYDLVIDHENFLIEVQKEVEAGDDKWILGQPKTILKKLAPRLLERMSILSGEKSNELLLMIAKRAQNKDIQIYFRNPNLESFMKDVGLSGEVYNTPYGYTGDYVALVNTNIAGGKTDKVMTQHVEVLSEIDSIGEIHNTLSVTRTHTGKLARYPWYRQVNQNFLRLYTPPESELHMVDNFSKKRIYDLVNYVEGNYQEDPLVEFIEGASEYREEYYTDIFKEGDKQVFGIWFNVAPGQKRTMTVEYTLGHQTKVSDGAKYQFVLDKQSGVDSSYRIEIVAPLGFYWEESGKMTYIYEAPRILNREVLSLTMRKREQ